MDNMKFYNKVRFVPSDALKTISAGRLKGFSDINPMWRIKALTETFGPCGIGWWYEITDKRLVPDETTKQVAAFMDILLFYKDPETGEASHGIPGTGGSSFVAQERNGAYMSDECFKMALTDAISVAAKSIGVAADVYYANDRSKYTAPAETKPAIPHTAVVKEGSMFCKDCGVEILPYKNLKGNTVSVERHCTASFERYGRVLCLGCIEKAKA